MLPHLDDGAVDWEQALTMARTAVDDGIIGVVCTPHWSRGYINNTRQAVLNALERLRQELQDQNIPLTVYPGSELRLDFNIIEKMDSGEVLSVNDTGRYALLELPVDAVPRRVDDFFWEMRRHNIRPIISHPERYPMLMEDPSPLYGWIETGALTQITAASILGIFGRKVQRFSRFLLEHRMVHILATDAHDMGLRKPRLSRALEETQAIVGKESAHRMVYDTPQAIVQGKPLQFDGPIPQGKPSSRNVVQRLLSLFRGNSW